VKCPEPKIYPVEDFHFISREEPECHTDNSVDGAARANCGLAAQEQMKRGATKSQEKIYRQVKFVPDCPANCVTEYPEKDHIAHEVHKSPMQKEAAEYAHDVPIVENHVLYNIKRDITENDKEKE
jgi:hypothetical protein